MIRTDRKALRRYCAPRPRCSPRSRGFAGGRRVARRLRGRPSSCRQPRLPSCSSSARRALYRDPAKSYFRCSACGTSTCALFAWKGESHNGGIFLRGVPASIRQDLSRGLARPDRPRRVATGSIERLAASSLGRSTGLSVLDVGCAYGPFLAAAKARGQEPFGLDAAEEAAAYVRRELGIPARGGRLPRPGRGLGLRRPLRRRLHVVRRRAFRAARQGPPQRRRLLRAGRNPRHVDSVAGRRVGSLRSRGFLRAEPRGPFHGLGAFEGPGYSRRPTVSGWSGSA